MNRTIEKSGRSTGASYPRKLPIYDTEEGLALLRELARRRGISAAALMRQLVREEAARVGLAAAPAPDEASAVDANPAADLPPGTANQSGFRVPTREEQAAQQRLRELTERLRAGERVPAAAIRREIETLRRHAVIAPPQQSGPPPPEWRADVRRLLGEVRAGIPEEWSEEELKERVEEAIAAVREERGARDR